MDGLPSPSFRPYPITTLLNQRAGKQGADSNPSRTVPFICKPRSNVADPRVARARSLVIPWARRLIFTHFFVTHFFLARAPSFGLSTSTKNNGFGFRCLEMWVKMRRCSDLSQGIVTFMLGRRSITTGIKPDGMHRMPLGLSLWIVTFMLVSIPARN